MTERYHITNLGSFSRTGGLTEDLDGYVHLTAASALRGRWDSSASLTDEEAEDLARKNREATARAEKDVAAWQAKSNGRR